MNDTPEMPSDSRRRARVESQQKGSTDEVYHTDAQCDAINLTLACSALRDLPTPVAIHAEDGTFVFLNKAFCRLSGYSLAELPDVDTWAQLVYGTDAARIRQGIANLFTQSGPIDEGEFRLRTRYGAQTIWRFHSTHLGRLSDGRRAIMSTAIDVTEQRRLEDRLEGMVTQLADKVQADSQALGSLERERARLAAVLGATSDCAAIFDSRERLIYINRAGRQMMSIAEDAPLEDLASLRLQDLMEQPVDSDIIEALAQGTHTSENALLAMSGERIPVSLVFIAHRSPDGALDYLAILARDISAAKHETDKLRREVADQRALNALRSGFVSMVSHEVRTPLASILSASDMLKMYYDRYDDARRAEFIDRIQVQVRELTELLDTVIAVGRAELPFHPEPLSIKALCEEVVAQYTQSTHRISAHLEADPPFIGDRVLLRQTLKNLLSNAIKYSPRAHVVYLHLRLLDAGHVALMLRDEGIGIPPDDMSTLFELFRRGSNVGKITGSGLGLALVYQAVRRHGGRIDVESTVGRGTTFTIILPLNPRGNTAPTRPPGTPPA